MKKLSILAYCLAGMLAFSSCQDDRDDNPTIQHPESFQLYISSDTYDLQNIDALDWSCGTPDYGYSAAVTYSVQISMDNTWNDATDDNAATYTTLATTYSTTKLEVSASELNNALIVLNEWDNEDTFPTTVQNVYVRVMSAISSVSGYEAYSETAQASVLPYYTTVSEEPDILYVVGNHQNWNNDGSTPKLIATDDAGTIYQGYAQLNTEFKFMTTTSWDDANYGGSNGTLVESGDNITTTPGFYQINVNLNNMTYTLATCTWGIVGDAVGSWENDIQLAYSSDSGALEAEVTFSSGEFKFRQDGSWDTSLGGSIDALEFNGDNITANPGTYIVRLYLSDTTYYATLTAVE